MTIIHLILTIFATAHSEVEQKPTLSAFDVVKLLDTCPSYHSLSYILPSHGKAALTMEGQISGAMRALQPVPLEILKEAVRVIVARASEGTPEFIAYQRKMWAAAKKQMPGNDDEEVKSLIKDWAIYRSYALLWVDRYLFDPPLLEKGYIAAIPFLRVRSGAPAGYVNRLYPVVVSNGSPHLDLDTNLYRPEGATPRPTHFAEEFTYYSSHFPRRNPWWK